MSHGPAIEATGWGLHSILTIEGCPYAVMQQWELWYAYQTGRSGKSVAMEKMPTDNIKLVPLSEMLSPRNNEMIVGNHE